MQFMHSKPNRKDLQRIENRAFWNPGQVLINNASALFSPSDVGGSSACYDWERAVAFQPIFEGQKVGVVFLMWKSTVEEYQRPLQLRMSVATWDFTPLPENGRVGSYASYLKIAKTPKNPANLMDPAPGAMQIFEEACSLPVEFRLPGVLMGWDRQNAIGDLFSTNFMPIHLLRESRSKSINLSNPYIPYLKETRKFMWILPVVHDESDGTTLLDLDYIRAAKMTREEAEEARSQFKGWGSYSKYEIFYHVGSGLTVNMAKTSNTPFSTRVYDQVWSLLE